MPLASPPSVNVARLTYLLVCELAGVAIALSTKGTVMELSIAWGLVGGLAVAGVFIAIESLMRGFSLRGFSTATFGLGVGLFCAWLLTRVGFSQLIELSFRDSWTQDEDPEILQNALILAMDVALYASLGFLGAVLALRSNRDDFAFIIPYVRFRQDGSSGQPMLLDSDAVMDGRVPGILRSGFLHGRLIVPRFVLERLQAMASSSQNGPRQRGQRGLDSLEAMQRAQDIQISVHEISQDRERADDSMETRLVEAAAVLGARLVTVDENLTKIARLRGVDVLNLNELDEALRPAVVVGQRMRIALVRTGKEDHQAVGYLPDGMMIVVNHAISKMGDTVEVTVVSTLQTAGGTMVFAELYAA